MVVTNTPDVLTNATAELALALMLAAARRLGEAERMVRAGTLDRLGARASCSAGSCRGTVVGIVGLGRIGTRVAELLRGFDVTLLYTARSPRTPSACAARCPVRDRSTQLLERSDFVTLHVPLTPRDASPDRRRGARRAWSPAQSW